MLRISISRMINDIILNFRETIKDYPIVDIAKSTGVKNISKHLNGSKTPFQTPFKGVPAHVKSSINYNDLIVHYGRENKGKINDGDNY